MSSAMARGAAVAAKGGGRPGMPRSPHQAEHMRYMAETEAAAMRRWSGSIESEPEFTPQMSPSRIDLGSHNRLGRLAEALRWQLGGVESELEQAHEELAQAKAQLDAAEVAWRRVLERNKRR